MAYLPVNNPSFSISPGPLLARASIILFKHLGKEAWDRRGIANKNEVSARALAYIIAGHELHHRQVLKEKYLR